MTELAVIALAAALLLIDMRTRSRTEWLARRQSDLERYMIEVDVTCHQAREDVRRLRRDLSEGDGRHDRSRV